MANLTAQQATDLANNLLQINQAIEDFRFDTTNHLSVEQKKSIDALLDQISGYAQDILALSTTLVMDEVDDSLVKIKDITTQIDDTYKELKNVQKAINVAAAVVKMAAAVISKNPQGIASAVGSLVNTLNA